MAALFFAHAPPGRPAQAAMAPADRRAAVLEGKTPAGAAEAAVLLLLSPDAGKMRIRDLLEWSVLLLRRNEYPGAHSGQISFPGGRREDNGESLWETACRETREETGIPADSLEKIGELTSLYIPPSNFLVRPFVAVGASTEIRPDPREVVDYKKIPLRVFDPEASVLLDFERGGEKRPAPAWMYEDYVIWGATAMILSELCLGIREGALKPGIAR
ncbi:MAG: CoA pyrophosphatase [Desulfovibrionaceae bacterium]|nr:CoA pyrophosphatase [Desulfovibrionaceae bacterium]